MNLIMWWNVNKSISTTYKKAMQSLDSRYFDDEYFEGHNIDRKYYIHAMATWIFDLDGFEGFKDEPKLWRKFEKMPEFVAILDAYVNREHDT